MVEKQTESKEQTETKTCPHCETTNEITKFIDDKLCPRCGCNSEKKLEEHSTPRQNYLRTIKLVISGPIKKDK